MSGSCTATFTLSLQFTAPDRFTGTLQIAFTGFICGIGGCTNRTWNLAGVLRPAAAYAGFGPGCAGSLGVPHLAPAALPQLGSTLTVGVDNLPANLAFMITGWSNSSSVLGPLPVDLGQLGMPGCSGRVSLDSVTTLLGAGNAATYTLAIPNLAGLLGARFYQQALVQDPGFNAAGAVVSDAAAATVGI